MKNLITLVNQDVTKLHFLNFFGRKTNAAQNDTNTKEKPHKKQDFSVLASLTLIVADHYTLFLNFVA